MNALTPREIEPDCWVGRASLMHSLDLYGFDRGTTFGQPSLELFRAIRLSLQARQLRGVEEELYILTLMDSLSIWWP